MRKTVAIAVLLILGNGGGGSRAQTPAPGPENDISSMRSEWVRDLQTKQLEPIMVLYAAESGFMTPDGSRMSGRDAIRAFLRSVSRKQTPKQIHEGIERGGFQSTSKNVYANVYTALKRLEESGEVAKIDNEWGLAEWYPARSQNKRSEAGES